MRQLIVTEFVSLDGVMQAPGGEPGYAHTGWVGELFSEELGTYKGEEQESAETMLLGRTTYQSFMESWPEREGPMADKINTMEKFVATTTLTEATPADRAAAGWANAQILPSPTAQAVADLKAGDGGPILVAGSRTLAQFLLAEGLVDQVNLQIFPVILGSGDRFYPESDDKTTLDLVASDRTPNGILLQQYAVTRA